MKHQLVSVTCSHFRSGYQLPAGAGPNLAWIKGAIGTTLKSGARLYRIMCFNPSSETKKGKIIREWQ